MPFDNAFDDIYKFGIKGAAEAIGAYAERLDEQIFVEGMLDRIFNQIAKADVVVADMTGRNPNVFYEVGYAHALGKIVLLLTRDSDDIPFDLKHRQHTVYEGSIDKLKTDLIGKLQWAIAEAKARQESHDPGSEIRYFAVHLENTALYPAQMGVTGPSVRLWSLTQWDETQLVFLRLEVSNLSVRESPPVQLAELFCQHDAPLLPVGHRHGGVIGNLAPDIVGSSDAPDGLVARYDLGWGIPPLPNRVSHSRRVVFGPQRDGRFDEDVPMRLRLHLGDRYYDFPFVVAYRQG